MPPIHVRRVTPDDWTTVRDIRLRALADTPDAFETTLTEATERSAEYWRDVAESGASGDTILSLFAFSGSNPVAMAAGVRNDEDLVQLAGVWVDPSHRRAGVATLLAEAVISWAREATGVYLWVASGNAAAERLYRSLGFEPDGVEKALRGHPGVTERRMILVSPSA